MKNTIELTLGNFENEVLKSNKPVLVDFWGEGCGPCRMIAPVLEEIAGERRDTLKVGKVDVGAHYELAARYNVHALPALLYFINGEVQGEIRGAVSKKTLVTRFNLPAAAPATGTPANP
jgi:thioredoxin 1